MTFREMKERIELLEKLVAAQAEIIKVLQNQQWTYPHPIWIYYPPIWNDGTHYIPYTTSNNPDIVQYTTT